MGYTVTVQPRNPELLKKMLEFGKANFRPWSQLTGQEFDYASGLLPGKELAYDNSPRRIGFDYKSCAQEREYVHALCRWMAIRVGTRKSGIPQYRYDGCEWHPVEPEKFDEHGWWKPGVLNGTGARALLAQAMLNDENVIKPELERLSDLWKKEEVLA